MHFGEIIKVTAAAAFGVIYCPIIEFKVLKNFQEFSASVAALFSLTLFHFKAVKSSPHVCYLRVINLMPRL